MRERTRKKRRQTDLVPHGTHSLRKAKTRQLIVVEKNLQNVVAKLVERLAHGNGANGLERFGLGTHQQQHVVEEQSVALVRTGVNHLHHAFANKLTASLFE